MRLSFAGAPDDPNWGRLHAAKQPAWLGDRHPVEYHYHAFLSNDLQGAARLRDQLGQRGLSVFHDVERIREGDLWLDQLQAAVDGCSTFVVLVGRDGVRRWIAAETQVAPFANFLVAVRSADVSAGPMPESPGLTASRDTPSPFVTTRKQLETENSVLPSTSLASHSH